MTALPFEGSTLVTYDVRTFEGQDNINFFAYAQREKQGKDTLLPTAETRNGAYNQYHAFQNYIITYLKDKDCADHQTRHFAEGRVRIRRGRLDSAVC